MRFLGVVLLCTLALSLGCVQSTTDSEPEPAANNEGTEPAAGETTAVAADAKSIEVGCGKCTYSLAGVKT